MKQVRLIGKSTIQTLIGKKYRYRVLELQVKVPISYIHEET